MSTVIEQVAPATPAPLGGCEGPAFVVLAIGPNGLDVERLTASRAEAVEVARAAGRGEVRAVVMAVQAFSHKERDL
jgi:hypothetical protein